MRQKVWILSVSLLLSIASNAHAQHPFDSKRDPELDLRAAKVQAALEHKNIFLDFGGNWCPPCLALDAALHQDTELASLLAQNFVVVRVAIGAFFSGSHVKHIRASLPTFNRYPHIVILAADGTLIHDETPEDFRGPTYHDVLKPFLEKWSPARPTP